MKGFLSIIVYIVVTLVPLIVAIAFFTLAERKVMAAIQRRRGPNVVGFWGLLQPVADGLKLIVKEWVLPSKALVFIYLLAPLLTFFLALISWAVIPFNSELVLVDLNIGVLYLYAVSSMGIFGVMLSGWSSNSKYAFLGSLRSAAQMISYEVSIGLILVTVVICAGSLNISGIVLAQQNSGWFCFPLFPLVIVFFVSMLAETNRAPFDLPEAEAELVAGFNVEYSSITFALFFLGEYCNMILMSALMVILFFGGWLSPIWFLNFIPVEFIFSFKILFFCFMFIFVRANFPRYRYDQLMSIGWKVFLPFNLGYLWFVVGYLYWMDALPVGDLFYNWGLMYDPTYNDYYGGDGGADAYWSASRLYRYSW